MEFEESVKTKIIAYLQGELKGEDLKKLSDWMAKSDDNARYYAQVKDIWEASVKDASHIAETQNEWNRFLTNIKKDAKSNILNDTFNAQLFFRFAAILFIGIIFGGLAIYFSFVISTNEEPVYITAKAPKGSVAQIVLADSTIVYLNAGSQIRYTPETKEKNREVFLEGEAWFDVTKNKSKPFIVHTPFYNVWVTGTQFNVKSYRDESHTYTTLEEGEVIITSSSQLKLAEDIVLKPGEQAVFDNNTRKLLVMNVDTRYYTSWRNNKLTLLNMSVKDMLILFERKYGVDIIVNDPDILDYHYTGTIKNETILEMLEIIKITLPIQYNIDGQKIVISRSKS